MNPTTEAFNEAIILWAEAADHLNRSGNLAIDANRRIGDRQYGLSTEELAVLRAHHDAEAKRLRNAARAAIGWVAP